MLIRSWLDVFKSRFTRPPTRRTKRAADRRRQTRRLFLEPLEDRRLLAFNVLAEYATGPSSVDMALAQLNSGSQLDLLVLNSGDATVGVRLGNADGTFGSSQNGGIGSRSMATGDLTGDGITDLVTSIGSSVGNGDGTFQPPQAIALPSQFPPGYAGSEPLNQTAVSVVTGDLNGDGKLDLAVTGTTLFTTPGSSYCGYYSYGCADESHADGYVNVLLGNGAGAFTYADADPSDADLDAHHLLGLVSVYFSHIITPAAVAIGDLNNDGQPDVIAASDFGKLSVLLGDGTGALGTPINSGSSTVLSSISLGDLDGDGILDTVSKSGNTLTVQKGQGDGRFVPSTTVEMGQAVDSAVMGDVNGDGKLDLVAVGTKFTCTDGNPYWCYDGNTTRQSTVVLGNGQGDFSLPISSSLGTAGAYGANFRFADVVLADLTGDGLPELATIENYTSVAIIARNDGNWTEPAAISISNTTVVEGNNGTVDAFFTVTLAGDHSVVSVGFSTEDNSAVAGADYLAQSGTLSFGPGVFSQTITVPVIGDRLGEGDEQFFVNLSNPTGALVRDGQAVLSILDNEPRISIDHPYGIDPLTVIEGDVGTTPAVFTVTLSMTYDQEVTVNYSTLTGHTNDIISAAGTLRFAPGETSKTLAVQVVGDLLDEELEAFNVYLDNASPNASIANGAAYCYIEDNDPSPPSISISDASVVEGNSGTRLMSFTVSLSQASSQGVWVNYRTANGTAKTSDNDYVAKSGTVYFAPGETTKTITVTIKGDKKKENDERFYVNLSGAINGAITDGQGVGTILNDDGGSTASSRLSSARAVDAAIEELMSGRSKKRGW